MFEQGGVLLVGVQPDSPFAESLESEGLNLKAGKVSKDNCWGLARSLDRCVLVSLLESDMHGATAVPTVGDGHGSTGVEFCSIADPAVAKE